MSSHKYSSSNPRISLPIILMILVTALILSCGDEDIVNPVQDHEPPATTTDLAVDSLSSGSIRLHWTAPGDDSMSGQATRYDIRYSTTELDSSTWDYGTSCTNPHTPSIAGTTESFIVAGLEPMTRYYFALRTSDESHNWSNVSNVASAKTPDSIIITWERTYGGPRMDLLAKVAVASDGGYVMTGQTNSHSTGWGDVYLVKTDEYGNQLWQHNYGGWMAEMANAIAVTPDGGYILAGWAGFTDVADDTLDAYIVRVDGGGNLLWEGVYGNEDSHSAYGISVVPDGGYIFCGYSETSTWWPPDPIGNRSQSESAGNSWLVRLDETGDVIWEHKFDQQVGDILYDVAPTNDGGFVAGGAGLGDVLDEAYLLKVDGDGNVIWDRVIGSEVEANTIRSFVINSDCNCVVTGWAGAHGADVSGVDVYVAEVDQSGNTLWQHTYGGEDVDRGESITAAHDGGYVITGVTASFGSDEGDVYILKIDKSGNKVWEKTYGGPSGDGAGSIVATPDGGYLIGAQTLSYGAGSVDFYLLKVDAYGNL